MKTIIIGNGIAALTAAQELRKLSSDLEIVLFTDENCLDYSRPRLPDFIAGTIIADALFMHKADWYSGKRFLLHTGTRVLTVKPHVKTVLVTEKGETLEYSYDTLIFACGSSANKPTIEGVDLPHIFTLRSFADAQAILAHSNKKNKTAVVIGGGLLGLEAARALKERGVQTVSVIELASRLLPRQLDETGSKLLQQQLEEAGLTFYTGAAVDKLTTDSVILKDGTSIPAQTVLLSMGVHSNIELAKNCGIAVNHGIIVNAKLQTSVPSVYAAGDCAEFDGIVWGIVPAALEQATVAARFAFTEMSGTNPTFLEYSQTVPKTQLKVAGIEAAAFGKAVLTPEELVCGIYTEHKKVRGSRYEKFVTRTDAGELVLCGAILYGSREHSAAVNRLLNKPITQIQIDELLSYGY